MTAAELHAQLSDKALAAKPVRMRDVGIVFAAIGIAIFIFAMLRDPGRAWRVYHLNFVLFTLFAQASVIFAAVQKVTKGKWAGIFIRFSEAAVAFLPLSLVLFVGLFFGRTYVFTWIHEPRPDLGPWLTTPWMFTRVGLVMLFLTWLSIRFVRADLRPDLLALRDRADARQ